MPRIGHTSGNGRPAVMGSIPYPRTLDEADIVDKIHHLEKEAYISVLRAFKAQADAITWEKEGLITELRRELRLSNEEHRDLLGRVNTDETIRRIREWRQSGGQQSGMHGASQVGHDPMPSPSVSASRKKQKIGTSLPSQSFGGPSPSFNPHAMAVTNQPSSSAAKRGSMLSGKGKKHKSYPSGPAGRSQLLTSAGGLANEPAEGAPFDPLIGRKVRTRWPDDNSFYEAVITNYNPAKGLHALVYDIGTPNETWEWVNLSEISPEDIQWESEDPEVSHLRNYGGPGNGLNRPPGASRGRGLTKGQSRKEIPPSQNGIEKKRPDDIQLLQTDTLIKEVERIFGTNHPDPVEMEKVKKILKEHEQSLTDAIARLGDLSDGDSGYQKALRGRKNGVKMKVATSYMDKLTENDEADYYDGNVVDTVVDPC
ncbi:hypothetical protein F511_04566 [Dorcoceras hygrometricum]|uniref:ENT domain-containing protein n=1 Tax=Dorcoceras hygrometricum TaxID=472368 RepID=A0A2Z7B724_9LAMI|nr:hypothetical protein F511_04566 [Dorcoceras hygrometricum]